MLTLPNAVVAVLVPFATLFTSPTWRKPESTEGMSVREG